MHKREKLFARGLYLIADFTDDHEDKFLWSIKEALRAGVDIVQLRAKNLSLSSCEKLAKKIARLCVDRGKIFIINDNVEIAARINASGVHLGPDDMRLHDARDVLGRESIIGFSLTTDWNFIDDNSVDYLAASPVFLTATKKDAVHAHCIHGLAAVVKKFSFPVVAIGGIDHENARDVLATGCAAIAVSSAIMKAPSPHDASKKLLELIDEHRR